MKITEEMIDAAIAAHNDSFNSGEDQRSAVCKAIEAALLASPPLPGFGLPRSQEPKYTVNAEGRLINRNTLEQIPDDEPVFILRGKDMHAMRGILRYVDMCTPEQFEAVFARVRQFDGFRMRNEAVMKEPDTH